MRIKISIALGDSEQLSQKFKLVSAFNKNIKMIHSPFQIFLFMKQTTCPNTENLCQPCLNQKFFNLFVEQKI